MFLIFCMISGILFIFVLMLYFFLSFKNSSEKEVSSPYECGFEPVSSARATFSYRFFLISILFLVFDVEVVLMMPIPYLLSDWVSVLIFKVFVLVLVGGLLYEYHYGSLDWL